MPSGHALSSTSAELLLATLPSGALGAALAGAGAVEAEPAGAVTASPLSAGAVVDAESAALGLGLGLGSAAIGGEDAEQATYMK
jgi:hypothetical protein